MSRFEQGKSRTPSFEEQLQAYDQETSRAARPYFSGKSTTTVCAMTVGAVLGLAQPSLATIHYSGPQNLPLDYNVAVDFTSIGQSTDFSFYYIPSLMTGPGTRGSADGMHRADKRKAKSHLEGARATSNNLCFMSAKGGAAVVFAGPAPNYSMARNFPTNYNINGAISQWRTSLNFALNGNASPFGTNAYFNSQTGYIGVRVPVTGSPGNFYYGWIQYQGHANGTGTILDWAYEDQQNMAIAAGSLVSANAATPVPALDEWGVLILFALLAGAGVAVSRRARKGEHEAS